MFHGPNDHKPGRSNKAVVFGAVERGGKIRAGVVPDSKMYTLKSAIRANVEPGTQISSDDNLSYRGLEHLGYTHESVNHSKMEWVRGAIHTNTIEGHWGQFRRAVKGTHVHISKKHLWKYVSEFSMAQHAFLARGDVQSACGFFVRCRGCRDMKSSFPRGSEFSGSIEFGAFGKCGAAV